MTRFAIAICASLLFGGLLSNAATFYVDASRPSDAGDGRSWGTAKRTIQSAVDLATAGDTVLVTNGVYNSGTAVTPGYSLKNRVVITNAITVASVNGAAVTLIDGSGAAAYATTNAVRCVYMGNGVLDGFTLRGGATFSHAMSADEHDKGGGVVNMMGAAAGTQVRNCIIRDGKAYDGGGVFVFIGIDSNPVVNCLITGNYAQYGGGADWTKLVNCTVAGNTAAMNGGGAYNCTVNNSICYGNAAGNYSGCTMSYSCATPLSGGTGNIAADPLFEGGTNAYYRLLPTSPCVNLGNNAYVTLAKDIEGNPRIDAGTVDMGAYERVSGAMSSVATPFATPGDGTVATDSVSVTVTCSTPSATIRYTSDGGDPSVSGSVYSNAIALTQSATIRAVASRSNMLDSAVMSAAYTVLHSVARPSITPPTGSTFAGLFSVEIACATEGAAIRYTTDGSDPTETNALYAGALQLSGYAAVKARAFKQGMVQSQVAAAYFNSHIIYVNAARPDDSGDGRSWGTAKRTIQSAVDLATAGDTVLVTNGVYNSGTAVTPGYSLKNRVVITNAITVASVNGAAVTLIDGSGAAAYATTNAVRCVYMGNGVLDGFTLRGGATFSHAMSADEHDKGGGVVNMMGAAAGTQVRNCIIRDGKAYDGGGVFVFIGIDSNPVVNCLITGNYAQYGGGADWTKLVNCTVAGNTAAMNGGGAYNCTVNNSICYGNAAGNCASCTVKYSCVTPLPAGTGNIGVDPSFMNSTNSDFRLRAGSLCLNKGTNDFVVGSVDILGQPRIQSGTVDMGAYEGAYKLAQTLAFPALSDKTYGDAEFAVAATASSGLGVDFTSATPGVVTVANGLVHIVGAGTATILARQPGNDYIEAAVAVTNTFSVNKAQLVVSVEDNGRFYGETNPEFRIFYDGFVYDDTPAGLDTPPKSESSATVFSPVGDYPITIGGAEDANYTFIYQGGTMVVHPKPLAITASHRTKTYGAALVLGTVDFSEVGLETNDTITAVTLTGSGTDVIDPAGFYAITPNGAQGAGLSNYEITYHDGVLTVGKAPLTITAANQTKTYGDAFSFKGDEFVAGGLVNADAVTTVTLTSAAVASDMANGTYPITPSNALGSGLANYDITYRNGTFTVGVPDVIISPESGTRFTNTLAVALSCMLPGATIRYTLDGTDPQETSLPYTNAIVLSATATVCARAFSDGAVSGVPTKATFTRLYRLTVANGTAAGVTAGFYEAGTNLSLAANPPPVGKIFGWWSRDPVTVDLNNHFDPAAANTVLSMPTQVIALAAVYVPKIAATAGFVDVQLTDAESGIPLGTALWSSDGHTWYPQGRYPMNPGVYRISFRSTDPHRVMPARQSIRITGQTVLPIHASFTRVPLVAWSADGNGTVICSSETGQVLPGKRVSLTARAAAGAVFVQWTNGDRNPVRTVAPTEDTLYTAVFRPKDDAAYTGSLPSVTLEGADSGIVGVAFRFSQANCSPLPARFSATDLPEGLAIDRTTGIIGGTPSKACTVMAMVCAAGPAGKKGAAVKTFTIAALPHEAQGTFSGVLLDGGDSVRGRLNLSVTAFGKPSAKVVTQTATYTFAGSVWDSESNGVFEVTLRTPTGETLALSLDTGCGTWAMGLSGTLSGGDLSAQVLEIRGQRNPFLAKRAPDYAAATNVLAAYKGYYTVALPVAETVAVGTAENHPRGSGFVTFTVKDDGVVAISGSAADGAKLSGSATLVVCDAGMPDEYAYVSLFFPLYSMNGVLSGVVAIDPGLTSAPDDNTVVPLSADHALPRWTYPGAAPDATPPQAEDRFTVSLGASGGFYDKLSMPAAYYSNLVFVVNNPGVPYIYTSGANSTTSVVTEAALPEVALLINPATGAVSLPAGNLPVYVAASGAYLYAPTNPAVATLAVTKATGLFAGSFNLYYECLSPTGLRRLKTVAVSHCGVLTSVRRNAREAACGQGYYLMTELWRSSDVVPVEYTIKRAFRVELLDKNQLNE